MTIHLSDHFTYLRLLKFTLPSITMMLFTSIYSVVDGFFVSNFVGKTAFAAITLIFPLLWILASLGFMLGAGGAALVGKFLGEKRPQKANLAFALFIYVTLISGIGLAFIGNFILPPVAKLLGATEETLEQCILYGRISLYSLPFFMLQFCFQPFFVTAEKPNLGLIVSVCSGLANMLLDFLLIIVWPLGLTGAALATCISEILGGLIPIIYFTRKNSSLLSLRRASWSLTLLLKACSNGFSEFLTNIASPLLVGLYNFQLLRLAGENGVAALGVVLYMSFVFSSIFLGYALGSAPLVSYNFGAKKVEELKNILLKSLWLNFLAGLTISLLAYFLANSIAKLFTDYDPALTQLTIQALQNYAPVFLLLSFNIYGESFFTALNNGLASALISLLRTIIFGVIFLFLLPKFLGLTGVWLSFTFTELATLIITFSLFLRSRHTYLSSS